MWNPKDPHSDDRPSQFDEMAREAGEERFEQAIQGEQVESEYDFPSDILADEIARNVIPIQVITLDLTNAGSLLIPTPGRGFTMFDYNGTDANRVPLQQALVNVYINKSDASDNNAWPLKYNRGFRGTFSKLFLQWSAQGNVSVNILIFKSRFDPWMADG